MRKKRLLARTGALLLLALLCTSIFAQNKVVTGKVTDSKDGSPLVGVSVIPEGASTGTTTDTKGEFRISLSPSAQHLTFSYIGYATRQLPVGSDFSNITMVSSNATLNEIVVIGY